MEKTHWREVEKGCLEDKLLEKASALYKDTETPELSAHDRTQLCVDIANYAMMVHDNIQRGK
jgi:hypothetical protein